MNFASLFEKVRNLIRVRHYSLRTEQTYLNWMRQFLEFHRNRSAESMGKPEVNAFLTFLAVRKKVSASTQNQALSALVFLYREVLQKPFEWLDELERAKRPPHIPVVLSREEVQSVFNHLNGTFWLMAALLYGCGLRLMDAYDSGSKISISNINKSSFVMQKDKKIALRYFHQISSNRSVIILRA
jgi:integrase